MDSEKFLSRSQIRHKVTDLRSSCRSFDEIVQLSSSVGCHFKYLEQLNIYVLITELMKKTATHVRASVVVTMDTTFGLSIKWKMTMLCIKTSAKAIPIAILVHDRETADVFVAFLSLIREDFPTFFGGNPFPQVFITDDNKAERKALERVFPESKLWLCHYHLAKTLDRATLAGSSDREATDAAVAAMKKHISDVFDLEQLESMLRDVLDDPRFQGSQIHRFLSRHISRQKEWMMSHRLDVRVGHQHTTNVSESQNNILKHVLFRGVTFPHVYDLLYALVKQFDSDLLRRIAQDLRSPQFSSDLKTLRKLSADYCSSCPRQTRNFITRQPYIRIRKPDIVNTYITYSLQ